MLERMETRKNHTRFGLVFQREAHHLVRAALTRSRSPLHGACITLTADRLTMQQFEEETLAKTTAAILQVCEWWSERGRGDARAPQPPGTHTVLSESVLAQWEALVGMTPNTPREDASISHAYRVFADQAYLRSIWVNDNWWQGGFAFHIMMPTRQQPSAPSQHVVRRSPREQLLWLWFRDVYVECVEAMRTADVFWAPLMHDLQCIQRDTEEMNRLRGEIHTLGTHMTHELCVNLSRQMAAATASATSSSSVSAPSATSRTTAAYFHDDILASTYAQYTSAIDPLSSSSQSLSAYLKHIPRTFPPTYADQKRTLDKLCLDLVKMTHRLALVWCDLFPQIHQLLATFGSMNTYTALFDQGEFDPLVTVLERLFDFENIVRDYAHAHALTPCDTISHRHVQHYIYATQHTLLQDMYESFHIVLRPSYEVGMRSEDVTDDDAIHDPYWTDATWTAWRDTMATVGQCVMMDHDMNSDDDNESPTDPHSDRFDAPHHQSPTPYLGSGVTSGLLVHYRRHWHRCWSVLLCHSIMQQMMYLPFHWLDTDAPQVHVTGEVMDGTSVRECTLHERLHYTPTTVPQLLDMTRMIVLSRSSVDVDDVSAETQLYLRAIQIEIDHVMGTIPEQAINGDTGYAMPGGLWMGVSHELHLPKIARDLFKSRTTGPVHVLSGQPAATTDGHGAGRLGKMEISALVGSGGSSLVQTFTRDHSDSFQADVCETCGSASQYNHMRKQGWCNKCNKASRGQHHTSYGKLLTSCACEISGMKRTAILAPSMDHHGLERIGDT
jgi:hypothetical protein